MTTLYETLFALSKPLFKHQTQTLRGDKNKIEKLMSFLTDKRIENNSFKDIQKYSCLICKETIHLRTWLFTPYFGMIYMKTYNIVYNIWNRTKNILHMNDLQIKQLNTS